MYQMNIVIQWQDGHYEEIRGVGTCWKVAKEAAVETANNMAIARLQGFRVLSDKEWRALPKPVSCNNWVPKKPVPPPGSAASGEESAAKKKPSLARSTTSSWGSRRAR